jgi:ankyrin repeat protein
LEVQFLLQAGLDPNVRGEGLYEEFPLLHVAVDKRDTQFVQALLRGGADITAKDNSGETAFHIAAITSLPSSQDSLKLLANTSPEVLNIQDKHGLTALHLAVSYAYSDKTKILVEAGADLTIKDNNGNTAMHIAKDPKVIGILLKGKYDVDVRDDSGQTPLHLAAMVSLYPSVVSKLVRAGFDPNAADNEGKTPISLAQSRPPEFMQALLLQLQEELEEELEGELKELEESEWELG